MAFCSSCGLKTIPNASFCTGCGTRTDNSDITAASPGATPAPPQPAPIFNSSPGVPHTANPPQIPPPVFASTTDARRETLGQAQPSGMTFDQKMHITMIVAAGLGALLTFTTWLLALIGACTGATLVLSIRLYLSNSKKGFIKTKKIDWILVITASSVALVFMLAEAYLITGCALIFVFIRSLIMYFSSNSQE